MLIIRNEQLETFSSEPTEQFVTEMTGFIRGHFREEVASLGDSELRAHVSGGLAKAREYGLTTQRDGSRFLNLLATYGWDFDEKAENAWMKDCLEDQGVQDPSMRLDRLIKQCIHHLEVEENNEMLLAEFGLTEN